MWENISILSIARLLKGSHAEVVSTKKKNFSDFLTCRFPSNLLQSFSSHPKIILFLIFPLPPLSFSSLLFPPLLSSFLLPSASILFPPLPSSFLLSSFLLCPPLHPPAHYTVGQTCCTWCSTYWIPCHPVSVDANAALTVPVYSRSRRTSPLDAVTQDTRPTRDHSERRTTAAAIYTRTPIYKHAAVGPGFYTMMRHCTAILELLGQLGPMRTTMERFNAGNHSCHITHTIQKCPIYLKNGEKSSR